MMIILPLSSHLIVLPPLDDDRSGSDSGGDGDSGDGPH